MASNGKSNHAKHMADTTVPSLKRDLLNAKLFMQQSSSASGDSLFEHLSRVIAKVIDERPSNVVDYFEQFSERVRLEKFRKSENEMMLDDAYVEPQRLARAKRLLPTLIEQSQQQQAYVNKTKMKSITACEEEEERKETAATASEEDDVIYYEAPASASVTAVKDLCELQFYWNLLGIGFPREEVFSLSCAMRKLKMSANIATCRFWGKLLGMSSDYYIAECTLTKEALENRIDAIEKAINIMSLESPKEECAEISDSSVLLPSIASSEKALSKESPELRKTTQISSSINDDSDLPINCPTGWNFSINIPQRSYRDIIEIPGEEIGHGVNRYVYYVCNNLDDDWIELPSATPHQINVTRRIQKYLTGNLDAKVTSFPIFPGTERNYLRAIIARISSGTHVAPQNFYQVVNEKKQDKEEEEEDDEDHDECNNDKAIKVNESYCPLSMEKLLKLDYWQHIKPEILKQGRICYFDAQILATYHISGSNSSSDNEDNEDDEHVDASIDEVSSTAADIRHNQIHPEMPAPLFASCSGDRLTNDIISPWTIRLNDVVESPLVLLQSNVWPGAFAFVRNRICDNIYIGFGHKYSSVDYLPLLASPNFQCHFPISEDVEEVNGPNEETTTKNDDNDADEVEAL